MAVNLLLLGPKLVQEHVLHVVQFPIYAAIHAMMLVPLRLVN